MKRKEIWLIVLVCICVCAACSETSEATEIPHTFEILQTTFQDGQGGTMEYYVIKTMYLSESIDTVTGLHTDAFRAVFDEDKASLEKQFDVSGHPAAIYQGEGKNYICCTISLEASVVMAYAPDGLGEEDALRILHSIFQAPGEGTSAQTR